MNVTDVVIDTNVLVAALKSKQGASHRLLRMLPEGRYRPNVSVPLFIEYEAVLKRPGLIEGLLETDLDAVLNYVLSRSSRRSIFFLWRPFLKDPKDDLVLEVAVESRSAYIITFNKRDFTGAEEFGIEVLTPREFLQVKGVIA